MYRTISRTQPATERLDAQALGAFIDQARRSYRRTIDRARQYDALRRRHDLADALEALADQAQANGGEQ